MNLHPASRPAAFSSHPRRWSEAAWAAGVLALYLAYLPFSGYERLYYDGQTFWELATRFITPERRFSLLYYSAAGRGYTWPLALVPWRTLWKGLGGEPIFYTRVLGALVAAGVYGWLGPRLWRALSGEAAPPTPGRRLALVATGWVLWRDYFNFPLTDFPALLLVGTALVLAARPAGSGWRWLGAGVALGLAFNVRPIYQLSLYPVALAALWPAPAAGPAAWRPSAAGAGRLLALAAGLAAVLAPQYLMFRRHFPQESPWHLGGHLHQDQLVRRHLAMGLENQKYETNVGRDYSEVRMWYRDPVGQELIRLNGLSWGTNRPLADEAEYWQLVRRYPFDFGLMYARRLFNGLDLQYPTPYIRRVYPPTWPLAWFNYSVLLLGLAVLLRAAWRWRPRFGDVRRLLLTAALVLPVLGALPMAVECRFMLPLHFGLCLAATLGFPAAWEPARLRRALRPGQWLVLASLYAALVGAAFALSAATQAQLQHGARLLGGGGQARPLPPGELP